MTDIQLFKYFSLWKKNKHDEFQFLLIIYRDIFRLMILKDQSQN